MDASGWKQDVGESCCLSRQEVLVGSLGVPHRQHRREEVHGSEGVTMLWLAAGGMLVRRLVNSNLQQRAQAPCVFLLVRQQNKWRQGALVQQGCPLAPSMLPQSRTQTPLCITHV